MPHITDLPNELLDQIAVTYQRLSYDNGHFGNVLLNFSMTCRAFYRVAFRYVYDDLDLAEKECTAKRVANLLRLIHRNPERGYAVQRLSIGPWDPFEFSPDLPQHVSFQHSYQLLKRTINTGKLSSEDVNNLDDYPCSVLVSVLFYLLPNIEDLFLILTSTAQGMSSSTRWLLLAMDIAPLPCRERVRSLELEYLSKFDNLRLMPCRLTIGRLLDMPNLNCLRCAEDETQAVLPGQTFGGEPSTSTVDRLNLDAVTIEEWQGTSPPLSEKLFDKYHEFLNYDPRRTDKLLKLRGSSPITEISFYNNPCAFWPIPDILRIAKHLEEFDGFIGGRSRDTREQVQSIHQALLGQKDTIKEVTLSYYKGFENRHAPNFQLDFSKFEKLELLQVSIILLADVEADDIELKDILPVSLKALCLKIRYTTPTPGPHRWDEAVLEVLRQIATYKDRKLRNLTHVDLRVINHPSCPSHSRSLAEARELMKESNIDFKATTYDPYKGTIDL